MDIILSIVGLLMFIGGIIWGVYRYKNWSPEKAEIASGGVGPQFARTRWGYAAGPFAFSLGGVGVAIIWLTS